MGARDSYQEYGGSAAAGRLHHPQRDRQKGNRLASLDPLTSITIACQAAGFLSLHRGVRIASASAQRAL